MRSNDMDKKKLFDAFDGFSQNLMLPLAEIDAMKKQVQSLWKKMLRLRPLNKENAILKASTTMASTSATITTDNVVKMMRSACFVWKC